MADEKDDRDIVAISRGRDLAGALHDVSNALTVMLGWIAEARHPDASRESLAYALRVLEERGRAARDLARQAIGVDVGSADETGSLVSMLSATLDALRVEAQKVHVAVRLETDASSTAVEVSGAADLAQIITNLVLNAIAFSPHEGTVRVHASSDRERVEIGVEDEGPGVPPELSSRIFEGLSLRRGGSGVGLAHSRAVARARGGDVDHVGGARFRVRWPRLRRPGERTEERDDGAVPVSAASPGHARTLDGVRVLLLEDDGDVCTLLEASLGARGAEVTIARNEAELSEAIAQGTHDAGLFDLSPIASGVEQAVSAFRARSPRAAVVFITGSVDKLPSQVTSVMAGTVACVRKPFEVSEVIEALTKTRA